MRNRKGFRGFGGVLLSFCALLTASVSLFCGMKRYYETAYPLGYAEYVERYAAEYGVDPSFVYAMIKTESDFRPEVVSVDDACGLMQLLPSTMNWLQRQIPEEERCGREDLFDPETNIRFGVQLLAQLFRQFGDADTVAAAYHAGINGVQSWLEDPKYSLDGVTLSRIPYADTAQYVRWIRQRYQIYQKLYERKG